MRDPLPIVPPKRGLNDAFAASEQPEETTSLSKNMRTQEADTGRLRVSQRAGYKKYNSNAIGRNYIAWSNNFKKNTVNGTLADEGWKTNKLTSFRKDGTLAPNKVDEALLVSQEVGTDIGYIEQLISEKDLSEGPTRDQRTGGGSSGLLADAQTVVFSIYMKWNGKAIAQKTRIVLRQHATALTEDPGGLTSKAFIGSWDTSTGVLTKDSGATSAVVDELSDGWYRVYITMDWVFADEATSDRLSIHITPYSIGTSNTEALGCYLWGAQLEVASIPTNYQPHDGPHALEEPRKTQALLALNHTNQWLDYTEEPDTVRTGIRTPKMRDARRGAVDFIGNQYILDGPTSVVKLSPKNEVIFSIDVPVTDDAHVLSAIHVDESLSIFVGVGAGGKSNTAAVFHYKQGPDVGADGELTEETFYLLWQYNVEGYVVDIDVYEAELFIGINRPDIGLAEVLVLRAIDGDPPLFSRTFKATHPLHGMEVMKDGSLLITAPSADTPPRNVNAQDLYVRSTAVSWKPTDYSMYREQVWSWLDADDIDGDGTRSIDNYADGDKITHWVDVTGQKRDLRVPLDTTQGAITLVAPRFRRFGIGNHPVVQFNGIDQGLVSEENPSTDVTAQTDQRTLWPAFSGATSTVYLVFRLAYSNEGSITGAPAAGTQGAIMGQKCYEKDGTADDRHRVLCGNRKTDSTITPTYGGIYPENSPDGFVSLWNHVASTTDPDGDNHPTDFDMIKLSGGGLRANVAIVCIVSGTLSGTNSRFRVDGNDAEPNYVEDKTVVGTNRTCVGWYEDESEFGFAKMGLAEIISYQGIHDLETIQKHEGMLANKYGVQNLLDPSSPHPYFAAFSDDPPTACPVAPGKVDPNPLNSPGPVAAKFNPSGELAWVISGYYGTGYDIISDGEDGIFTIGEVSGDDVTKPTDANGQGYIRKLIDKGDSVDADGLVAKDQHNMVTGAHDFTGIWTTSNLTVTPDDTEAPDGTTTADLLDDASASQGNITSSTFAATDLVDGEVYTFSVYLKTSTSTASIIQLFHVSGTKLTQFQYNWSPKTIDSSSSVGNTEGFTMLDVVEDEKGWYRFIATIRYDAADGTGLRLRIIPQVTAASLGAVWAWGAQLERGKKATKITDGINAEFKNLNPKLAVDTFGNLFVPAIQREGRNCVNPPAAAPNSTSLVTHFGCRIYDNDLNLRRHIDFGEDTEHSQQGCHQALPNLSPPSYTLQSPGVTYNRALFTQKLSTASYWSQGGGLTATAGDVPAPNGLPEGDELTGTAATDVCSHTFTDLVTGEDYTFSVFIKRGSATAPRIIAGVAAESTEVQADYTVSPPKFVRTDVGTGTHKHRVVKAANDFYRVGVTFTALSATATVGVYPVDTTETKTVFAWGAQMEHGDVMRPYQPVPGSTPHPPSTENQETIDLADKVTFLCTKDVLPSTLFGEDATIGIWTLGAGGLMTVDDDLDPAPEAPDQVGRKVGLLIGQASEINDANGDDDKLTRTILASDVDSDGNTILRQDEVYKFECHFHGGNDSPRIKLYAGGGGTAFTSLLLTYGVSPAEDVFTPASAGAGTHFTTHDTISTTNDDKWIRMEVQLTYDRNDGDGSLVCELYPGAATKQVNVWGAKFGPAFGFTTIKEQTLVKETPNGLSVRESRLIAVNNSNFYVIGRDMIPEIPLGGSGAIDQTARYVSATAFLQKVFATDGRNVVVLDPAKDGMVRKLVAEQGEVPPRVQFLSNWRNRLVAARTADDPQVWFMGKIGSPGLDWDYFTPPLTSDQAAFFQTSRAGRAPDTINSVCPYDDRNLILGCDAALWYMQDDPRAGGTWQQLTDITGMHYGNRAWCKDPRGYLYFFGSRGGFYRMAPGEKPVRMTQNNIERRLSDIDLDAYYVECIWNYRAEGIEIFVVPFKGVGSTPIAHYFWGQRYDEWREDFHSDVDQEPTALTVIDGEKATDRRLLYASNDGHILEWDEEQKNDDGNLISQIERIGPLRAPEGYEARWTQLEMVLSRASDGATVKIYRGEDAESLGTAIATISLTGGRNPRKFSRMRGANLWFEISNENLGESFAYESGNITAARAGRSRDRSTYV